MFKFSVYSLIWVSFSAYCMSLDKLHPDVLGNICYDIDPEGYERLINPQLEGDIKYISATNRRTENNCFTYTSLKHTDLKSLVCVNTGLYKIITTMFERYKKNIYLKEPLYKDAILSFLKKNSITFVEKKIKNNECSWNMSIQLKSEYNFGNLDYTLSIMMMAEENAKYTQFDSDYFADNRFSKMLFLCVANCISEKNRVQVNRLRDALKGGTAFYNVNYEDGYPGNGVLLRMTRKLNDQANWNVFRLDLFTQFVDLRNMILENNDQN